VYAGKLHLGIILEQPLTSSDVEILERSHKEDYENGIGIKGLCGNLIRFRCDQSDNVYAIGTGLNDFDHHHLPESRLFKPRFPVSRAKEKLLDEHLKYLQGIHLYYDDTKNMTVVAVGAGIKTARIQMNSYMLGRITEPHVIIYDALHHLVVSLESHKIIRGNPRKFNWSELERALRSIRKHEEMMKRDFHEMVEHYGKQSDDEPGLG
jgi:hypothetical protein